MKISIVTISFNQVNYLKDCFKSVKIQNYNNIEHIVVDPGSTDGSRDLINTQLNIIKIFEKDLGPADGLNKGFEKATGDILFFLNSDDELLPNTLTFVAEYFENKPNIDILCGEGYIIDSLGNKIKKIIPTKLSPIMYAYGAVTVFQQGIFFRKVAYKRTKGFNIKNRTCWDGELFLNMALNGDKFGICKKSFANFRVHESSITGSQFLINEYKTDSNRLFEQVMKRRKSWYDFFIIILLRAVKILRNPRILLYFFIKY